MQQLYKHQQKLVDRFPHKELIAWGLGSGKSLAAISLGKKSGESVLIVCPKMLKSKWERDARGALEDYLVLTKEEFKRDFKKIKKYNAVIVDEAHSGFGSLKTACHKALYAYLKVHKVEYVWLLTGTPYTSTPFSIYALARLLGHKWDWMDFRYKYFRERYIGHRVIFEPKQGIEPEIAELVRQIGSVVRLDECIDVPLQTFEEESFPWTPEQKKAHAQMQLKESNPLVRFGKAHQIAQGILIGDQYTPTQTFPALKNKRILELAEENEKLIVFSRYNLHLEHLFDLLTEAGILAVVINGATKDRDSVISAANSTKRIVLLIQADCAEGYELPSFSLVIHACHTYSFVKYSQSLGRVLRINAPKPNLYLSLSTKKSSDEAVFAAVKRKEDFHESIFIQNNPEYV